VRVVLGTWAAAYAVAILATVGLSAALGPGRAASRPTWFVGLSALALWVPFVVGMRRASRRDAEGPFLAAHGLRLRPVDALGVPIGVASQLVLVGLVTLPFRRAFPDAFSDDAVVRRARDLVDAASGAWMLVLVAVVVIGAPLVEELFYRGFMQRRLAGVVHPVAAWLATAVWFAAVHVQVAEFPGLLAFALVLGGCWHATRRLGLPLVAHVAFNATGLAMLTLR
jgi:membrane protease YdiL (CAAX protease family)